MTTAQDKFIHYYINPSVHVPVVTALVLSHPGLINDLCLISDNKDHVFNKVNVLDLVETDKLFKNTTFHGYPMLTTKSSLDFGDSAGKININLLDAGHELLDAFHKTRGFERAQLVTFDCMLTDPYTINNISRYDVLNTSLSNSEISLAAGVFNALNINGVPVIYDEDTNPGLF